MSQILIDAISNVTVAGGLVRVDCVAVGPNNQQRPSGTLLIPGPQAGAVLNRAGERDEGAAAQAAGTDRRRPGGT